MNQSDFGSNDGKDKRLRPSRLLWVLSGAIFSGLLAVTFFTERENGRQITNGTMGRVYLAGKVHNPGAIQIPGDGQLTLSQAIILGGDLSDFGDPKRIKLLRENQDQRYNTIIVDLTKINLGQAVDPLLKPGDQVIVAERLVSF